ncbi:DUF6252 family protein [Mucilaginibacter sabulilitoris]|uniref:DUF6252 family protein n=1 Tax=Mucilaginibacter sabulilitoris TaxID=1173583 RepID=A0ABZ0TUX2_9SPHI|nr:DUF6252 family protein [Mucilaginibacter sabulilitoris]WPU96672.1 DUF6252 family protein [Mucilaginibacter sabulilitoris]
MKKTQLIMLLLLTAIGFQSCKKDATTSASTTSDKILSANINGNAWNPDTVRAAITYNDAAKTKAFTVVGTANQQQVRINITLPNSTNDNDFPLATYKVDATTRVVLNYDEYKQLPDGSYDYVPVGTVEAGSGSVIITAIDKDKKLITGTYSFSTRHIDKDEEGNIISITTVNVLLGTFTNLPYSFVAN